MDAASTSEAVRRRVNGAIKLGVREDRLKVDELGRSYRAHLGASLVLRRARGHRSSGRSPLPVSRAFGIYSAEWCGVEPRPGVERWNKCIRLTAPVPLPTALAELPGRAWHLGRLAHWIQVAVVEQRCATLAVVGHVGPGKSLLLRAFVTSDTQGAQINDAVRADFSASYCQTCGLPSSKSKVAGV